MTESSSDEGFVMDRPLQRTLLLAMQAVYPQRLETLPEMGWEPLIQQLSYLEGRGWCDAGLLRDLDGEFGWRGALITSAGLDHLDEAAATW